MPKPVTHLLSFLIRTCFVDGRRRGGERGFKRDEVGGDPTHLRSTHRAFGRVLTLTAVNERSKRTREVHAP